MDPKILIFRKHLDVTHIRTIINFKSYVIEHCIDLKANSSRPGHSKSSKAHGIYSNISNIALCLSIYIYIYICIYIDIVIL